MRFRFSCSACGDVTIPGPRLHLVIADRRTCWLSFECPDCATSNGPRGLTRAAADVLIATGAEVELRDRPRLACVPVQPGVRRPSGA